MLAGSFQKAGQKRAKRPHHSAAREAFEEAGVIGAVGRRSVGSFSYEKRLKNGGASQVLTITHLAHAQPTPMRSKWRLNASFAGLITSRAQFVLVACSSASRAQTRAISMRVERPGSDTLVHASCMHSRASRRYSSTRLFTSCTAIFARLDLVHERALTGAFVSRPVVCAAGRGARGACAGTG
jgi:hypothetical protein